MVWNQMLKFNKKVEYALIALQHMSNKQVGELTTARELSERYNISLELMGKILQRLMHKKFIASIQGVKGGYFLTKPPDKISVQSVINAIEGSIVIADCLGPAGCPDKERERNCEIKYSMKKIQSDMMGLLENYSLLDFKLSLGK
jgi:Rrf2 family protein